MIKSILEYKNLPYTPPSIDKETSYTVKKGDTLYSIAQKYNTTVPTLKDLNELASDNLSIGQILKLPSALSNNYTVKAGDTIYRIATQNNTTVQAIKDLNNLTSDVLTIGQILKIPTTEIIEIPTITTTYMIKKGDTLYSIAQKYNTTVDKLKQQNNLATNNLTIGQILQIPATSYVEVPTETITYTVVPGDTLYSIAQKYNTTVNNIKTKNNLTTNLLSVGQKLLIP